MLRKMELVFILYLAVVPIVLLSGFKNLKVPYDGIKYCDRTAEQQEERIEFLNRKANQFIAWLALWVIGAAIFGACLL